MDNRKRAKLLSGVLEDLKQWDWTDNFEISQEEGEAILQVLEKWDSRRKYFKKRYETHREEWKEACKQRYHRNKVYGSLKND